ncbi:hypothetical protein [Bremerella cremea]|uniref:hypothetical protein n=1 Tax=Bremerella cremea TaxID=1031537 RepID=UPI0031EBB230
MGFAYSWLAVRGASASSVLRHIDLQPTDQQGTHPTWPLAGIQLRDEWYVVVAKDADFAAAQDLAGLSQFGEVICCAVEEHLMIATSASWQYGQPLWQIHHDSHQPAGHHHLTTSGPLPACYRQVCEEFVAANDL